MCVICQKDQKDYDYTLNSGLQIPICCECGMILWEVKFDMVDPLTQMVAMIEYTHFKKKCDTLINKFYNDVYSSEIHYEEPRKLALKLGKVS